MKSNLVLFFLLNSSLVFGQVDSTELIVQRVMKQQKIVGLSLVVIKNGQTLVNKGYGLANAEVNVPVSPKTVFKIGSLSKQFFATAIMKLQEEGKLSIEDTIHRFFPDAPNTWREIKVKHLMTHTSGLPREGPSYSNLVIQPDLAVIRSAYALPLDFKTGEKYQYCNLGYFMLAEIIKQLSGMPWEEYIRQKLFIPAGMKDSRMTDFYAVVANRANGYLHQNGQLINPDAIYAVRPSGGFLSTSTDMVLWEKALREKNNILSKQSWEKLSQPFVKISTDPKSKAHYGFGWIIDERNGHQVMEHGSASIGFRSYYARFIADDLTIIIMTNTDEANPAALVKVLSNHYFNNQSKRSKD